MTLKVWINTIIVQAVLTAYCWLDIYWDTGAFG